MKINGSLLLTARLMTSQMFQEDNGDNDKENDDDDTVAMATLIIYIFIPIVIVIKCFLARTELIRYSKFFNLKIA